MSEISEHRNAVAGTIRLQDGRGTVRMEHVLPTDLGDVWSALTSPARLERWIGRVSGELELGGRLDAVFTSGWSGTLRVDECDAPRRLLVSSDPGAADETTIEATLQEDARGTRLVVEERGISPTLVADYGAGWQVHIEDLAALIDGREPSDWSARARELRPHYVDG